MAKPTEKNPRGLTKKQLAAERTKAARETKADKKSKKGSIAGNTVATGAEGNGGEDDESANRGGHAPQATPERESVSDATA
jgi:hypothetical protein